MVQGGSSFRIPFSAKVSIRRPLVLQPLLENAVKHSLYGLTGEVEIQINFWVKGNALLVSIINPFDPQAGQPKGAGFGIEAVERRLFLIFGRYDLLKKNQQINTFEVKLLIPQIND